MSQSVVKVRSSVWYIACGIALLLLIAWTTSASHASPRGIINSATSSFGGSELLDDIYNTTLGFEKIFVINLPSRTDHRDAIALAGSLTGLDFDFIDGVTSVEEKALPPGGQEKGMSKGELGNWRAHLNAARTMVEQGIQTALILEDDADWDIRVHDIMRGFAKASRLLVQPVVGTTDQYLDPTFPDGNPNSDNQKHVELFVDQATTAKPVDSPYGNISNWDMLWLGHCGTFFPNSRDQPRLSSGRAVILNDVSVPEPQHVNMQFADDTLVNNYPPHTRVVYRAHQNVCTLGYALTLNGARKLVYELGIHAMLGTTDVALQHFCDGNDDEGVDPHMCLTVQPQIFQHHRPVGSKSSQSDIAYRPDEVNDVAFTRNVRWSTRMNLKKLINGETDYFDQYKDGDSYVEYGWSKK